MILVCRARSFFRVANHNSITVSMRKGERYIKDIYEALRSGPKWQNTMLFIGYGAGPLLCRPCHGAWSKRERCWRQMTLAATVSACALHVAVSLCLSLTLADDHVVPPHEGVPADDAPCNIVGPPDYQCAGPFPEKPFPAFDFRRLGLRVAAMLISPWVAKSSVFQEPKGPTNSSQFELTSVPATVKNLFNLSGFLTKRDAWAGSFDELLLLDRPRTDAPLHLPDPAAPAHPWLKPPPEEEDSSDVRRRAQGMSGAAVPQHCSATQGDSARSCQGRGHTTVKQRRTIRVLSRLTTTPEPNIDAMDAEDAARYITDRWVEWMRRGRSGLKSDDYEFSGGAVTTLSNTQLPSDQDGMPLITGEASALLLANGSYYFFFNNWGRCLCWPSCGASGGPSDCNSTCTANRTDPVHTVVAYRTQDFIVWQNLGVVFTPPGPGSIFRPIVVRNPSTNMFVMWYERYNTPWDPLTTGTTYAVALSSSPAGPFLVANESVRLHGHGRGDGCGDANILVDDDGMAYHVRFGLVIERLNPDFLGGSGAVYQLNPGRVANLEAPVFFKHDSWYYLMAGSLSCAGRGTTVYGWRSKAPLGPYTPQGVVGTPSATRAQGSTSFLVGRQRIWLGNQWETPHAPRNHELLHFARIRFNSDRSIVPLEWEDNVTLAVPSMAVGEQLSLQTREWWRWVVTRLGNYAKWVPVDGDEEREELVKELDPDLFDWHGDGRWNIMEWARLRGIAVAQSSGLEYEEAIYNLQPNASAWKLRDNFVEQTWGIDNGLALDIDGRMPPTYSGYRHKRADESHPFMTAAAPKWSLAVQQSNARAGFVGDSVSQDNAVGDIGRPEWNWGFGPWEEAEFVAQYGAQLNLSANFSARRYIKARIDGGATGDSLMLDRIVQPFILFSYELWRDAWIRVVNATRRAATSAGRIVPAHYGNVGEAQPIAIVESPHHDVFWIESSGWSLFPPQQPADPPTVVSSLVLKVAGGAVRGHHKPIWRCSQGCREPAAVRLYLAEAVANGANSWHLHNGYMMGPLPPAETTTGTEGADGFTEHLAMMRLQNGDARFLFTDRERVADGAVLYCLSCTFWRHAGVLSGQSWWRAGRSVLTHEVHLTAVARLLEDHHALYEVAALGYAGLWENQEGLRRLRLSPANGGWRWIVAPAIDAMSDDDVSLISEYVRSGGTLIVTHASSTGAKYANLTARGAPALASLMANAGRGTVKILPDKLVQAYLGCGAQTCVRAAAALFQHFREATTSTRPSVTLSGAEPSTWVNVWTHGAGPATAVHLTNHRLNATSGNVRVEGSVAVSVRAAAVGLRAESAVATLYQPHAEPIRLPVRSAGEYLTATVPGMDVYAVLVFASPSELRARAAAATARTLLERALISSRSHGMERVENAPAHLEDMMSSMKTADQLLLQIQGGEATETSEPFFDTMTTSLQKVAPALAAIPRTVQHLVNATEAQRRAATVSLCASGGCVAAVSFEPNANESYEPAANAPAGFAVSRGAAPYTAETGFGFVTPSSDRSPALGTPGTRAFDTLLPDDLHRGGVLGNQSATFRIILHFPSGAPAEVILSVVSGWFDLGASNVTRRIGVDGYTDDAAAWMSFASTSVGTLLHSSAGAVPEIQPCLLGIRGLNPGYFHARSCRVKLSGASSGTKRVTLDVVFAAEGGTTGAVGVNTGSIPFAWLVNGLAVQTVEQQRPAFLAQSLADSDASAAAAVRTWAFVGPFDGTDGQGLTTIFPPEREMLRTQSAPRLTEHYVGKRGANVSWATHRSPPGSAAATLPLGHLLAQHVAHIGRRASGSVAYASVELPPAAAPSTVRIVGGMSGLGRVWVVSESGTGSGGGQVREVVVDELISGLEANEWSTEVELGAGKNTIVVKSVHTFAADFVVGRATMVRAESEWSVALAVVADKE